MNIKKSRKGPKSSFSDHLISTVCQELLSGTLSYVEASRKYNIKGTATIRTWMMRYEKQYGSNLEAMGENKDTDKDIKKSLEFKELQSKNAQLQAALELARLENLVLNTMIDIADEQLHTDIRKKSGAKQ